MNLSRRHVLKLGTAFTAICAAGVRLPAAFAADAPRKVKVGLQLYSVRKQCAADLPSVLNAVGKMGYQGVEFAGYHGRSAEDLKKLLDEAGLQCCGTHTALQTLLGDELPKTVAFNQTIGNKYLIVPSLPKERRASIDALKETAALLTDAAAKVKDQGMRVGYHAHGEDFQKVDGQTPWDVIFSNAGPGVVMQLDIGNCMGGGGDPVAVLKAYPGRSATIHIKEHGGPQGAAIGEGTMPFDQIFAI